MIPELITPMSTPQSFQTDFFTWEIKCPFDPPHVHEFPGDWQFGGPSETDFRADPRWKPSSYYYIDERLDVVHVTTVPRCDDEAIDFFTQVRDWGFTPKWVRARRPDHTSETLKVVYDSETDEVVDT